MITVYGSGVSLEELRAIEPVTPPGAGRRWRPIRHGDLVDAIRDEVATRGWSVEEELFSTTREGADMVGALLLSGVRGAGRVPKGMRFALGFLNSNARRKALQLTVGASVLCCTNGICSGSIILNRVHDHTVDLVEEVEGAVDRYAMEASNLGSVVRSLRDRELSRGEASGVLMRAGHRGLIGWAAVGRVDAEYRNPTFSEHGRNNSWALLNAFTYAARRNIAATRQMEVYDEFRRMLPVLN